MFPIFEAHLSSALTNVSGPETGFVNLQKGTKSRKRCTLQFSVMSAWSGGKKPHAAESFLSMVLHNSWVTPDWTENQRLSEEILRFMLHKYYARDIRMWTKCCFLYFGGKMWALRPVWRNERWLKPGTVTNTSHMKRQSAPWWFHTIRLHLYFVVASFKIN